MPADFDIAIIGSGFGGSLMAMVARRIGLSVLLVERGKHPRFAIGESTAPLTNLLIEELANRYDLPRLIPLTTYGQWKRTYPEVGVGLKRGFTFYKHEAGQRFANQEDRKDQLMVAASPRDEIGDTHWLRSEVDHFLVNEAIATGVEYVDETHLSAIAKSCDTWRLAGMRRGEEFQASGRFVIDATGPRGALAKALSIQDRGFYGFPETQGLFSHFEGVRLCAEMPDYRNDEMAPYPPDAAALHHVVDGGWMWVLRFDNGVTSAGFAATSDLAAELNLFEGEAAWPRFLARFPSIQDQFAGSQPIRPFVYAPNLPYRAFVAAGCGWAMLPSAAAFIDPLFSTGMPLTLLGIDRLGAMLSESWGRPDFDSRIDHYSRITLNEADYTAHYVRGCYLRFPNFAQFTALSMFYFAAASFAEMARRLDRRSLIQRFLAVDHPTFAPSLLHSSFASRKSNAEFEQSVANEIEPLNIAGLCDPAKRNWYPVDLNDVILAADKLGYTPGEMRQILANATWV